MIAKKRTKCTGILRRCWPKNAAASRQECKTCLRAHLTIANAGALEMNAAKHFPFEVDLSLDVIALVLFGAALHATWNALVKSGTDKPLDSSMVALGASITSIFILPFLPLPDPAAWPFVAASVAIHFCYFQLVGAAYRHGDIGVVYPLMRGVAPLIVASLSGILLHEVLSLVMLIGVATISAGVMTLAFESRQGSRRAMGLALLNAGVIATYTYVDGLGARLAGNPVSYTLWISLLPPLPLFAVAFARRGVAPVLSHVRLTWMRGLFGGASSLASYGLALFAMTKAPIAAVAALRETSILFALLISIFILKETAGKWRYVAGGMIAMGALILKLG